MRPWQLHHKPQPTSNTSSELPLPHSSFNPAPMYQLSPRHNASANLPSQYSTSTLNSMFNPFNDYAEAGPSSGNTMLSSNTNGGSRGSTPLFPSYDLSTSFRMPYDSPAFTLGGTDIGSSDYTGEGSKSYAPFAGRLSNFFPPNDGAWGSDGATPDQSPATGDEGGFAGKGVNEKSKDGQEDEKGKNGHSLKAQTSTQASAPTKSGRAGNKRRQKFSRTRTGCLCCRSRRIKCDEGRPTCKRCIIAKRVVSGGKCLHGQAIEPS